MDLLVVGWDAATSTHLRAIDLPFWDSLDHSGTLLPEELFHDTYISTGNAWTTITTGAPFEDHRVLGFVHGPYVGHPLAGPIKWVANRSVLPRLVRRGVLAFGLGNVATEGGRGASPQSTDVPFKRVWEYLSGNALVFGLPVSYPTWETNGILISGVPAPTPEEATQPLVSPAELQPTVFDEDFTGYHVQMDSPVNDENTSVEAFCDAHVDKTEAVADRYIDLYSDHDEREDFEFGFVMLRSIDDVLHSTTDKGVIERIYRATDRATRRVIDEINPDDVLVLSDHGMGPRSPLRVGKNIGLDHDTTRGVWGGTAPFGLERQLDVTPAILEYFGIDVEPPQEKDGYELVKKRIDETAVHERLADLGYR
ncbi:arylsulfatase [Halobacteriales archaeon QS_3_64_16]|nr:MAG: arylsulfatase [Halobacteriales archaeon QS_3_64_16]